ncbi:MAG: LysR family transcriptional regulator [Bacillota bacterium]|nr:LysR family transcriptional regulator [Bacillota bacterium]
MELVQLRTFLKVAEHGSVTKAAAGLHLTQPAVTQHIRALERQFGTALFERTGRGMLLNGPGELLRDYARKALAAIEDGQQVIADIVQGRSGRLILAAGVTTSIFHLPRWLQSFREAHPDVDITVKTGRSREVARMALDREIDLGLVTSPVPHPDLEALPLFDEQIVLVGPPDSSPSPITQATLSETPLILFPRGTGFRAYLDQVLAQAGAAPHVKMETDSVESIKGFVQVGLGMSFLPLSAVQAEIDAGLLVRVDVEGIAPLTRTTAVVRRKDRYFGVAARDFLAIARGQNT